VSLNPNSLCLLYSEDQAATSQWIKSYDIYKHTESKWLSVISILLRSRPQNNISFNISHGPGPSKSIFVPTSKRPSWYPPHIGYAEVLQPFLLVQAYCRMKREGITPSTSLNPLSSSSNKFNDKIVYTWY